MDSLVYNMLILKKARKTKEDVSTSIPLDPEGSDREMIILGSTPVEGT